MAKKAQQNKITHQDMTVEQNTISDDNLLPSAEELQKLNTISPDILPWILTRTEKEQDARIH